MASIQAIYTIHYMKEEKEHNGVEGVASFCALREITRSKGMAPRHYHAIVRIPSNTKFPSNINEFLLGTPRDRNLRKDR